MNWISLLSLFAGPLGGIINKGIATAGAAIVATSVAHGNPIGDVSQIVGALMVAVSTVITGVASSQGIQIPRINADMTNGVKVVSSAANAPAVNGPLG